MIKLKKQLVIIGGGFAGFWSAISAIRESREIQKRGEVEITLINPDNYVTIRARLNELSSEGLRFELDKYLKPLGVHQIIGRAEIIDPQKSEIAVSTAQGIRNLKYDYLILAAGSSLQVSNLPGIAHTFNVDSFDNVQRLENHIIELGSKGFREEGAATFVVVGSEFKGLEAATGIEQKARTIQAYYSGAKADFRIVLLEGRNQVASQISKGCWQYIQDVIGSKNIEVMSNSELAVIGPASVLLSNGERIATRTVIWTEGMVANFLTRFFTGARDGLNRLTVDRFLKLPGYNNVIAAGNVAHSFGDNEHSSLMDCQYAQFEGRWAGHNAINDLFNAPLHEYVQPGYVNCVDLGEPQTLHANDWERAMQKRRYDERAAEEHINSVTMFPWQDIEETVKASYPEIPRFG
ncbi:MAG TPA: FAD-dependent oxidoreductase [Chryseolinea sp.]|nr:FAD-dependent oxidoreductase [Chryseolinea sp.]